MLVLKIGGNEIDNPDFIEALGTAIAALENPPIVVHGGGKEIRQLQEKLGIAPQYIDGLRVTDTESLSMVQMVLAGRVNKRLVAALSHADVDAFGMSGIDRACVRAKKLEHPGGDLGHVGEVTEVRTKVFTRLLGDAVTPVLSPICYGPGGNIFNVNADHVAVAIAKALHADELVFVTNVPGVLKDGAVQSHLSSVDVQTLVDEGVIQGGMIPKIHSALEAMHAGVPTVRITNLEGLKTNTGTRFSESINILQPEISDAKL